MSFFRITSYEFVKGTYRGERLSKKNWNLYFDYNLLFKSSNYICFKKSYEKESIDEKKIMGTIF